MTPYRLQKSERWILWAIACAWALLAAVTLWVSLARAATITIQTDDGRVVKVDSAGISVDGQPLPPATQPASANVVDVPPGPLASLKPGMEYRLRNGAEYSVDNLTVPQGTSVVCLDGHAIVRGKGGVLFVPQGGNAFRNLDLRDSSNAFLGNGKPDGVQIVGCVFLSPKAGHAILFSWVEGKNWTFDSCTFVNSDNGWFVRSYASEGLRIVNCRALTMNASNSFVRVHGDQSGALVQHNIFAALAGCPPVDASAYKDPLAYFDKCLKTGKVQPWQNLVCLAADGGADADAAAQGNWTVRDWTVADNTLIGGNVNIFDRVTAGRLANNSILADGHAMSIERHNASAPMGGFTIENNVMQSSVSQGDYQGMIVIGTFDFTRKGNAFVGSASAEAGPDVQRVTAADAAKLKAGAN